jgi:hypothetical protein
VLSRDPEAASWLKESRDGSESLLCVCAAPFSTAVLCTSSVRSTRSFPDLMTVSVEIDRLAVQLNALLGWIFLLGSLSKLAVVAARGRCIVYELTKFELGLCTIELNRHAGQLLITVGEVGVYSTRLDITLLRDNDLNMSASQWL